MNTLQSYLLRAIATLILVAIPLASCVRADETTGSSLPGIAPEPTGEVEILPTPTPASSETTVIPQTSATDETAANGHDVEWIQATYGEAWAIGYPAGWTVNDAGAHAGSLTLQGDYDGHNYTVTYDYPIGIFADSLDAWVDEVLLPLSLEQRDTLAISDISVANIPTKKILNMPTHEGTTIAHHAYIWRTDSKNWRLITITQSDDQPVDVAAMEQLFDQLLRAVQ